MESNVIVIKSYYPFATFNNNILAQKRFNADDIDMDLLEKLSNKTKLCNWIEYVYRDMIKLTIDNTTSYYIKKCYYDDNIITTNYNQISENNFPIISKYHYESKRKLHIYSFNKYDIILTNFGDYYTVHVELFDKNITELVKYADKTLKQLKLKSS